MIGLPGSYGSVGLIIGGTLTGPVGVTITGTGTEGAGLGARGEG